ncbi:hypothetical protein BGZ61DRAFT_449734 [Ilyonectria robusta]|uniref:uncharacterized protein n=1 Tax=Ilyonectria robusta TaxID=1079257 RepID=UPI001E8D80AD|nr:uncharacterized protein BGZ61DRAFT_449734 [Ilyonectria robusta]KAH8706332.1 hypothetical protein BGZ61DRAFT_449734 [Ilyonectria robusta]
MSMQTLTWELQVSTTSRICCDTDETRGLGATDNRPDPRMGLVHSSFQNSLAERSRTYVIDLSDVKAPSRLVIVIPSTVRGLPEEPGWRLAEAIYGTSVPPS